MEETADSMWHWLHYQQLEGYMNKDDHEPGMQRSRGQDGQADGCDVREFPSG